MRKLATSPEGREGSYLHKSHNRLLAESRCHASSMVSTAPSDSWDDDVTAMSSAGPSPLLLPKSPPLMPPAVRHPTVSYNSPPRCRPVQAFALDSLPSTPRRECPLLCALMDGRIDKVQQVLDANPEAATDGCDFRDCEPPLCAAACLGCEEGIFRLLLENGAEVHQEDCRGRSPVDVLVEGTASSPAFAPSTSWGANSFGPFPFGFGGNPVLQQLNGNLLDSCKAELTRQRQEARGILMLLVAHGADISQSLKKFGITPSSDCGEAQVEQLMTALQKNSAWTLH